MKFRMAMALLFALAVFPVGPGIRAEGDTPTYEINYRLNEGECYGIKMSVDTQIVQEIKDQTIHQSGQVGIVYRFEVSSADGESGVDLSAVYDSIQAAYQTPYKKTAYNSNQPSDDGPANLDFIQRLLDNGSTMTLTSTGGASVDETPADSDLDIPDLTKMSDEEKVQALIQLILEKKTKKVSHIDNIILNIFPHYAGEPVALGGTWSDELVFTNGDQTVGGTCLVRLANVRDNIALLEISGNVALDVQQSFELNGFQCSNEVHLTGDVTGNCEAQMQNGWPIRGDYRIKMSGTLRRMGKEIPVRMEIHIRFEPATLDTEETKDSVADDQEGGQPQ